MGFCVASGLAGTFLDNFNFVDTNQKCMVLANPMMGLMQFYREGSTWSLYGMKMWLDQLRSAMEL